MNYRHFVFLFLSCFIVTATHAKGYFNYNSNAERIYDTTLKLQLNKARSLLAQLKIEEPQNLIAYHLEDYIDFFSIYVSEDSNAYERMKENRERRLNKVRQGHPDSPYFLYAQAEIRLHWAILKFRFDDYLSAFTDINKAHKLLLENQERFPNFLANKKDLGILHAAIGTIPDNYRWALAILSSLDGDIEQGKREIQYVLSHAKKDNFAYTTETQIIYSLLLLHLDSKPQEAWQNIQNSRINPSDSPIYTFITAHVAMRAGYNDDAIQALNNAPKGSSYTNFPQLHYMLGKAKIRTLNTDGSKDMQTFINTTRGKHYVKSAYRLMAWSELIDGNTNGYSNYMRHVLQKGNESIGGDKNALIEAQKKRPPHIGLLKARLLYDGGYYQHALDIINTYNDRHFSTEDTQLEFIYRKARILHGLNDYDQAIQQYNRTIKIGSSNPAFFACNSALQAGLIEEKRGNTSKAYDYFNICLDLRPVDYQTGLHQQAKAGLSRL